MDGAATVQGLPLPATRFLEFLRQELKPTPTRWRATLRITLACVAASFPVMAFHLHVPLLVMILMFLITKEDTTATLLGTILGLIGVTVSCGLLLLTYICFADLTWMRILLVPVFIAIGLFLNRIVTLGPLGSTLGVPLSLGMIAPDIIPSGEFLTRFPFYFWWAAVLGLAVNLAVQYLLNPERAQSVLARGLISRLDAVQDALLGLAGEQRKTRPGLLTKLALEGAAEQLHLIKTASAAEPFLKKHYEEVGAQIILIDRLVTAAAVLEEQEVRLPNEALEARLRQLATAVLLWRQALLERHWPQLPEALGAPAQVPGAPPMLLEMERVVHLVSTVRGQKGLPDELKVFPKSSPLVSDAFSNPAYLQFAVKGALAAFICYLIFTLTAYQAIYTSVVTCIVCSLSTIGASAQKGILRFAGSVVGGVLGVITLTCIFPYVDSIGGFWVPFAAVTGLAAYVTFGSPALSYGGYQIGLAFYKCVLQSYGPYTELRVVRDRLIGIFLGLTVFGLINNWLWPVKALETARAKLASVLQTLAKLAGLPDEKADPTSRLTEAYGLRLRAYQDFRAIHELLGSAKFELRESVRRKLEQISSAAQRLLLYLLAIIQHRPDLRPEAVTEALRLAGSRFRTKLADQLQILADSTLGQARELSSSAGFQPAVSQGFQPANLANRPEREATSESSRLEIGDMAGWKPALRRPDQDLQGALVELEKAAGSQIGAITDPNVVEQVRARLALYQEGGRIAIEIARELH